MSESSREKLYKFLYSRPKNKEEYVEWVADWRKSHDSLIEQIRFVKLGKNLTSQGVQSLCQSSHVGLSLDARLMYAARRANKANLHAEFKANTSVGGYW